MTGTMRDMDYARQQALNATIGAMMGDQPEPVWRVMTRDESAYCMEFTRRDSSSPAREAEEWLADSIRRNPAWVEERGYHVVKCHLWPDYAADGADAVRFINWALLRSPLAALATVVLAVPSHSDAQPGRIAIATRTHASETCEPLAIAETVQQALIEAVLATYTTGGSTSGSPRSAQSAEPARQAEPAAPADPERRGRT